MNYPTPEQCIDFDYHRNGISGAGVYQALFDDPENGLMIVMQPSESDRDYGLPTFVSCVDILAKHRTVSMFSHQGVGNAWRGDYWTDAMDTLISRRKAWDDAYWSATPTLV